MIYTHAYVCQEMDEKIYENRQMHNNELVVCIYLHMALGMMLL